MTRKVLALGMVVAGFALQAVAYLFWATPIGKPTDVSFSNPRVPFAPVFFIVGVVLVFLAALVYELLPDRRASRPGDEEG